MKSISLGFVLLSGVLFGFGLAFSAMVQPEVVLSFLLFQDLGLLLVLGVGVFVTLLAYKLAPKLMAKPVLEDTFGTHPSELNRDTIVGSAIFGIGWGLCGVCPGPAIAGLGVGNWPLLVAIAGIFAGAYAQGRWFGKS